MKWFVTSLHAHEWSGFISLKHTVVYTAQYCTVLWQTVDGISWLKSQVSWTLSAVLCLMLIRTSNEMLLVTDRICTCPWTKTEVNPLNGELNPICHLLALLGAHHILHVSRIGVKHLSSWAQEAQRLRVTYPLRPNWAGFVNLIFLPGEWELILSQNTVHYFLLILQSETMDKVQEIDIKIT